MLGKDIVAESASYVPPAWLAFCSADDIPNIENSGITIISRTIALENFAENSPFIEELIAPNLSIAAADPILGKMQKSRAKTLTIDISQLTASADDFPPSLFPTIAPVLAAILAKNRKLKFKRPSQEIINPMSGTAVEMPQLKLDTTSEVMLAACGITDRMIETARKDMRIELVSGHLW